MQFYHTIFLKKGNEHMLKINISKSFQIGDYQCCSLVCKSFECTTAFINILLREQVFSSLIFSFINIKLATFNNNNLFLKSLKISYQLKTIISYINENLDLYAILYVVFYLLYTYQQLH